MHQKIYVVERKHISVDVAPMFLVQIDNLFETFLIFINKQAKSMFVTRLDKMHIIPAFSLKNNVLIMVKYKRVTKILPV